MYDFNGKLVLREETNSKHEDILIEAIQMKLKKRGNNVNAGPVSGVLT